MKIISETNIEKTKQTIKKSKPPIIVKAQDDNFNRKILEYGHFQILLSPEAGNQRKHTIRQIDSGFNHVLGKIATKNSVSLGIDISEISKFNKVEKARRLTKIAQNLKICRKTKTKIAVLNNNNKKQAQSLLLSLGASTKQAKEAISTIPQNKESL